MGSLGFWQYERLQWKTNVINQLNQEYNKAEDELNLELDEINEKDILFGRLTGQFLYQQEIFYGPKSFNKIPGYHVITPFLTSEGIILVNRGWSETNTKKDMVEPPSEKIEITGIIRKPEWNKFTPNNDPKHHIWTKLNIRQIADAKNLENVAGKILYLTNPKETKGGVISTHGKWYPRNKHKQYMLFWFAMTAIFLSFFAYFTFRDRISKTN
ncbi:MAG: SURF1 family protein [Pseudomonadota bacterium]